MKRFLLNMRRTVVAMLLLSGTAVSAWAANTKTTVSQVTAEVTLADDVDYIVTSSTPFTASGVVNITNTEHAVLILAEVKPSKAIANYLKYVKINGEAAKDNTNCMVKLYNRGCIIMPYSGGDNFRPLTVYSEQNFQGQSTDNFGLENDGGYMNTLNANKLNNKIRSFKLKRGYMVTFSLKSGGRGYSRCFIAADKDLEMATLPALMDKSISSYRVFKWYDTGKKNLANQVNAAAMAALNVQSSYDWGQGNASMLPDYEWVPNHIYEDYPSSSTIGKTTQSPHTKNNNEPRNSADDHPQDLATILNNWENMMRTGLRLCSPASWDGSDYVGNAGGFLREFFDSIDARGWRCDIIDLHCYWAEGTFNSMKNWTNALHRPIWISEWCWGASWNNNGAFASGVTEAQVRDALQRICTNLNNWDYVERYYYWNSERDPSRIYKNGSLTPAGQMYAALDGGVGYNGKYDYIPTTPRQLAPSDLTVDYDKTTGTAKLKWHEYNGEMNGHMCVERNQKASGSSWEVLDTISLKELAADYTYEDKTAASGYRYRIQILDGKDDKQYSKTVMAVSDVVEAGDPYPVGDDIKYMGGNVFVNGDFALGTYGWTNGKGEPIGAPYFQVIPVGGADNDAYLQAYGNGNATSEQSLNTAFDAPAYTDFYFSGASCNSAMYSQLVQSNPGKTATYIVAHLRNETPNWTKQLKVFNTGTGYEQLSMMVRSAAAKAQVGQLMLARLFATQDSAFNDGLEKLRQRAEAFIAYNTDYPSLNTDLAAKMAAITTANQETLKQAKAAIDDAIEARKLLSKRGTTVSYTQKLIDLQLYDQQALADALADFQKAATAEEVLQTGAKIDEVVDSYLNQTAVSGKIKQAKFANATGWTTKCGTYTGGDQRTNKVDGVTFWNAWWSGIPATDLTQTMAISQEVTGLDHGLYALQCKASTQHFCLSDQHGYIAIEGHEESTDTLTADYMDLPTVAKTDRWQTLLSAPVYVGDEGSLTIGFEGSKKGAQDKMWREVGNTSSTGDQREGWWGATDFTLMFTPLYKTTVEPNQWGVICLPYAVHPSADVKFYEIAGINESYTELCLNEINETQAGVPFLYRADKANVMFLEFGKAKSYATDGESNLRGILKSNGAKVPLNHFILANGAWEKVTDEDSRPVMPNYTGIIRPLDDASSKVVSIKRDWEGPTMPIHGITDAEKEHNTQGISTPKTASSTLPDGIYTLDGRIVTGTETLRAGIYIKVVDGRAFKTVVK